jgi:glycine/D-amino acid oxidase-like deaminating enzyme
MSNYYAAVFGAGIAGVALAHRLSQKGKKVLLIDPFRVDPDGPGPPAGLVNPCAGRKANLVWESKACYDAFLSNIRALSEETGRDDLFSSDTVLRPAITGELAEHFQNSLREVPWPEGWADWIEAEEVKELIPWISENHGGLRLHVGLTVFVDNYLSAYRSLLSSIGVEFWGTRTEYHEQENGFTLEGADGQRAETEHVIVAAGADTPGFEDWSELGISRVKGQILLLESDQEIPWHQAISALGYILRRKPNELIVGSTYEHHFDEDRTTTEDARNRLLGKLDKILPGASDSMTITGQLAGVRASASNHLPVLGRHRLNPNLLIFSAMGSKGLIYSVRMAGLLADHITDGAPLPKELDTERIYSRLRKRGKI